VFVSGESPVNVQSEILDFFFLGELHNFYLNQGARFLDVDFLNQCWIASRLVCSFCEAVAGSLSVASTAVSSAKVAVVDSDEVGRSVVYTRYNNGPMTLP
jgi:hypothetical protein